MERVTFREVDLSDPFFDSLKAGYEEFPLWFARKADEPVFISKNSEGRLHGFLYLKKETGEVSDVEPPLPPAERLKVGTLKIVAHGSKLGERYIKKVLDSAIDLDVDEVYVTVFEEHAGLIRLFRRYGFIEHSTKTTPNGTELVFVRSLRDPVGDARRDYPIIHKGGRKKYLLAIYPEYHTRLLPDSILRGESSAIVEDLSHTNSIHKVYITHTHVGRLEPGDLVAIYRTSDKKAPAYYRSVVSSICVVEEVKSRKDFSGMAGFINYARPHSVFPVEDLREWWNTGKPLYVIRMMYNAALRKRVTRGQLLEEVGINPQLRINFIELSDHQFDRILELGDIHENLVVD